LDLPFMERVADEERFRPGCERMRVSHEVILSHHADAPPTIGL
jgi:hypothetical protein